MSRAKLLAAALSAAALLAACVPSRAAPRLPADLALPGSWDVGTIDDTAPVSESVTIRNTGRTTLEVRLLSSCSCLTAEPERLRLASGASGQVRLTLDPAGLSGGISKLVLAKVENANGLDRLLTVEGSVRSKTAPTLRQEAECEWCKKLSAELRKQAYDSWRSREGVLHYYYSADCRNCTDFLDAEIPRVAKAIGRTIEVDRQDIREPGVLDELDDLLAARKLALEALPVLVIDDIVLQGEKEIRARFEKAMRATR
jgi:hypothetical protein